MIQGLPLTLAEEGGRTFLLPSDDAEGRGIQFGPEQLIARVGPVGELGEGGAGLDAAVSDLLKRGRE